MRNRTLLITDTHVRMRTLLSALPTGVEVMDVSHAPPVWSDGFPQEIVVIIELDDGDYELLKPQNRFIPYTEWVRVKTQHVVYPKYFRGVDPLYHFDVVRIQTEHFDWIIHPADNHRGKLTTTVR